jgi:hypothetical protein
MLCTMCGASERILSTGHCFRKRITNPRVAIDLLAGAADAGSTRANDRNRAIRVLPVDAAQVRASRRRICACAPITLCVAR